MKILEEYSIFRLRRVLSITVGVFCISVYSVGSSRQFFSGEYLYPFLIGEASIFMILCAAYIMNDLCDLKYDMVNRPDNVYIQKRLSLRSAKIIVAVFLIGGAILAVFVNRFFFAVILIQILLSIIYNMFSKQLSFFKPVFISLLVTSIYPLSIALTSGGNPSPRFDSLYIFPVWLFFTTLALEIAADARDIKGDTLHSAHNYILSIGEKKAVRILVVIALLADVLAYLPYVLSMCGPVYLAGTIAGSVLLLAGLRTAAATLPTSALHFNIVIVTLSSLADILAYQ
jgi:4-hydroxybenzoate polyprenyltransferase